MSQFVENQWLETEECCRCGMMFAMPLDVVRRRKKDRKTFYCPAGHSQHYVGKTAEQRLKDELRQANNRADEHRREASEQRQRATAISRSYQRVRERVKNGVCPCCNRTFENLARHMQTKHPEYGNHQQLRTMRLAYGLTQAQLADEVGVNASYVSLYERGMELPKSSECLLDEWVSEQCA